MKELSTKYMTEDMGNFSNVAVEISSNGNVKIKGWPKHPIDSKEVVEFLKKLAMNIEKIKNP